MTEEEKKDILRYFILCDYRDGDYFLLEEYEELEDILKRSFVAKELEDARYKSILGRIDKEEYNKLRDKYLELVIPKTKRLE